MIVAALTSGCSHHPGLSESSKCEDYNNASSADQQRFLQDEINKHHSSRGVNDVAAVVSYNCSTNIDRTVGSVLDFVFKDS